MRLDALRSRPTPEALFARYRETGAPEALGDLLDAVSPGLFRLALSLTPDAATAEDALQETFLFAHPFHGVTDDEGTATLRLPPGDYRVSTWHEYEGFAPPEPRAVKVAAGETATGEFTYRVR